MTGGGRFDVALEFAGRSWVWFDNMDGVGSWNRMDHGLGAGRIWVWLNNMDGVGSWNRMDHGMDLRGWFPSGFSLFLLTKLVKGWFNKDWVRGWVSN